LLISIVLLILTTCNNFAPGGGGGSGDYDPDEIIYTDVVYSPDGKSVTIYLDGATVPVTNRQSRALSRELAIAGHDYFEVAFYTGSQIVRATWELNKYAYVSGSALRGVTYDHLSTNIPPSHAGHGAAILFVGKKTDKTLLAVGKLSAVNNGSGDIPSTTIAANTVSITFSVAALESSAETATSRGQPGFRTDNSPQSVDFQFEKNGKTFHMFKLKEGSSGGAITNAYYEFYTVVEDFSDYYNGIRVAGPGSYGKRQPRYPTPDGKFQDLPVLLDTNTVIMPVNNTTTDLAFDNPIHVQFNTASTVKGSVFAFVFEIPVYPLINDDGRRTKGDWWYIRASYDSYWLDLDDGAGGAGGAVLIGTGEPDSISGYKIRVVVPPFKYLYPNPPSSNPPPNNNRAFNINGLLVELIKASGDPFDPPQYLNNNQLTFTIGMKPISVGTAVDSSIYGVTEVVVNYYYAASGVTYQDKFLIVCDNPAGQFSSIPSSNYIVVDDSVDDSDIWGIGLSNIIMNGGSGVYVIIAARSFDVKITTQSSAGSNRYLFIVVAGRTNAGGTAGLEYPENPTASDRTFIGRGKGNITVAGVNSNVSDTMKNGAFINWGPNNSFYFGLWPFNTPLIGRDNKVYSYEENLTVNSTPYTFHKSHPYTLNGGGSWVESRNAVITNAPLVPPDNLVVPYPANPAQAGIDESPANFVGFYLRDNQGGRIFNVKIKEDEVTIHNRPWLF
jgi:hypothetical protein